MSIINECLNCIRLSAEVEKLQTALHQINNINEHASIFNAGIYEIIEHIKEASQ